MRIALWNVNGLAPHKFELELFLKQQQIDVMLISETHFTDKNYLKINGYNFYHTQHSSGKADGGTGIIIKASIKHYELTRATQSLDSTRINYINYYKPCHCTTPNEVTENSQRELIVNILTNKKKNNSFRRSST